MGMDVIGKNPRNHTGEYFRNNVWFWKPLWDYCCTTHPELVGVDPDSGFFNDGYGLEDGPAAALGAALLSDVANGATEEYRRQYMSALADLPRNPCPHCGATGIRTDEVGLKMGQHDKALDPEVAVLVGRTHGWCNGCNGIGTQESFLLSYGFSVENVQNFGLFLLECGGFEVW